MAEERFRFLWSKMARGVEGRRAVKVDVEERERGCSWWVVGMGSTRSEVVDMGLGDLRGGGW